jgi:hypothetical protein
LSTGYLEKTSDSWTDILFADLNPILTLCWSGTILFGNKQGGTTGIERVSGMWYGEDTMSRNSQAFWDGWLSAFNLFPVRRCPPPHQVEVESDEEALRKIWEEIGKDLAWAMGEHAHLLEEQHGK